VKVGAHNGDRVSGKVPEIFRLWGRLLTKTEIRQRKLTSFSFFNVENSYSSVLEALYPGTKLPGHEADHSPTPTVSLLSLHGMHRANFTFTLCTRVCVCILVYVRMCNTNIHIVAHIHTYVHTANKYTAILYPSQGLHCIHLQTVLLLKLIHNRDITFPMCVSCYYDVSFLRMPIN
jgi:hypothetical protein